MSLSPAQPSRESLASLFWPEYDQARSLANLRRAISSLHHTFGADILLSSRESIGIHPDAPLWLDVREFHRHLAAVQAHPHPQTACPECIPALQAAVDLYRGEFLAGLNLPDCPAFDDWQFFQREELRQALAAALEQLANTQAGLGNWEMAIQAARRWVSLDRLHEPAQRLLIQAYARAGQRSAALRQYAECARGLQEELGQPPEAETTALYTRIRAGQQESRPAPPQEPAPSRPAARAAGPLIQTKLNTPQPRSSLVTRSRLLGQLDQGAQCALTLICAPAGYGKTTLVAEWSRHSRFETPPHAPGGSVSNRRVCWLSLDETDNDPTRFLAYLIAAVESVQPEIGAEARVLLQSPQPLPPQAVLAVLINELQGLSTPVSLVLDDYQFISSPAIHQGISFLLEHLPANFHLVIATRSDPPIPLARLRACSQLVELRAANLRFNPEEAAAFLNRVMRLSLTEADIVTLEQRTEGWIAGLQMAALSMQGRADISTFIQAFSGSHRYVLDYLAEEVLNRQPEAIQAFLLKTSILERMCAELCDAIIKDEGGGMKDEAGQKFSPQPSPRFIQNLAEAGSSFILDYLDRANLFLLPLDEERTWYRYHHLFADLLKARLQQSEPEMALALHLRASEWYDRQGLAAEAIQHAFTARDYDRAAGLIERYGPTRWSIGDPMILKLTGRLSPDIMRARPKLGIYRAWMLIAQGQLQPASVLLDDLKQHINTHSGDPDFSWMRAYIDLLFAYAGHQAGEQAQAALPDYRALELIPEQHLGLRNTADTLYAILLNRRGEFELAAGIVSQSIQRDMAAKGTIAISMAVPLLARIRMMQGRLGEAAGLCEEYLRPFTEGRKKPFYAAGGLHIILGEVLYEWNDLEGAEKQIREGIQANEPWQNILFDAIGYSDLVGVQQARGDLKGAADTLDKLERMLQGRTESADMAEELLTVRVRHWLAKGDLARASEWADQVEPVEPLDYLQDWSRVSLARVRLVQGRYADAQRIIEKLSNLPGAGRRTHRQIRVSLFLAVALFHQNQLDRALQVLESCLSQAEPGGYLRVFLDTGGTIRELLTKYLQRRDPPHKAYAQQILSAFDGLNQNPPAGPSHDNLVEPLTPRELDVLHLLVEGLSNRMIAEKLVLTEGTIKFHIHSILEKLQARNRTQAIVRAKELRLID